MSQSEDFGPLGHPDHPELGRNDAGESTALSTEEILEQRGSRYGAFKDHSAISSALRSSVLQHYVSTHPEGPAMEPYMMESIIMICHKLGRIANGDPHYDDNWKDIAGYAQLVVDILHGKNT
jgi:hypothetical protein